MLTRIITESLRRPALVLLAAALLAAAGLVGLSHINIDAFPDTTPVQVQINTTAPALVATEVERQITFPIEMVMGGVPGLVNVRSISQFGLSQVTCTFEDGTDIYRARQIISERLAAADIPPGLPRPELGPVATGLGEVLHYLVKTPRRGGATLTELRTLHDWTIRPDLRTVRGAAEINSWGGMEKQYEVRVDPIKLFKYGLTLQQVSEAVRTNNVNVGGGYLDRQGDMLLVHGIGRTVTLAQIEGVVLTSQRGTPVFLRDVAEIVIGHEQRRGIVTADGDGEAVLGLGFMRIGENSYDVTRRLRTQLEHTAADLPPTANISTVYDRTELVDQVIDTVRGNLCEGALLVVALLFVFLGNLRAGLVAAATIPLSLLFAFLGMWPAGIAGTLLSLGAIDFGIVVDSSVVIVENIVRRLSHGIPEGKTRADVIREAACEVRLPAVFGQLIILVVYLPILTLEGVEGKMFRPMALTVMLVLVGSLILTVTVTPVLAALLLPYRLEEREVWLVRACKAAYRPILNGLLRHRAATVGISFLGLLLAALIAPGLGSEFVPQLSEGAIVIGVLRVPGTSLEQSAWMNTRMEKFIREQYPDEVARVWSRVGEPEVNTDAGSPESTDMFVTLKPRHAWRKAHTQAELVEQMSHDLRRFKGQVIWFTQPIEMRLNEMLTGARSDLALKLFGKDIQTLIARSRELEAILRSVPGCVDLSTEQVSGQPILQVRLDQTALGRYGVSAQTVLEALEVVPGKGAGDVTEDQLRFPLAIRLPEMQRRTPEDIARIPVISPSGERIPLARLATVQEVRGPKLITSEWGKRRIAIQCNVRGRDMGGFVAEAQARIDRDFKLPPGYRLEWGGQFENMVRAQRRLLVAVPAALGLIVLMLYLTYRDMVATLVVFAGLPFACAGGVLSLWVRAMPISISAGVGFITLSGVSVLSGMILMSAMRGGEFADLMPADAVSRAALSCLRTVLMTALVASVGFVPMASSTGMGTEVQRPLATVVIGGVAFSTLFTLFLLPVLYCSIICRRVPGHPGAVLSSAARVTQA